MTNKIERGTANAAESISLVTGFAAVLNSISILNIPDVNERVAFGTVNLKSYATKRFPLAIGLGLISFVFYKISDYWKNCSKSQ